METLGVPEAVVLPLSFVLLEAEVVVLDEHPDSSIAAMATPETPVLNLFIVLFILISPLFLLTDMPPCNKPFL